MRRKDKEISNKNEIDEIINKALVCRIAFMDIENNRPYIIPANFGYADDCLFIHTAKEGTKIDLLNRNNNVCFEIDIDVNIIYSEKPSKCTSEYRSVIGFGKAYLIEDDSEKVKALTHLMNHYVKNKVYKAESFTNCLKGTGIIKIVIQSLSGKKSIKELNV